MTTNDAIWLSGMDRSAGSADSADVLKQLQDSALGLLAGLDRAPKSLRIKADQVEIELAWPEAQAGAVAAPGAPVTVAPPPGAPILMAVPTGPAEPSGAGDTDSGHYLLAHTVGVFYRAQEPGGKPFVEPGEVVSPGQQIGIIEAMKLMIPVEAEIGGRIVEALVADGSAVEYGDKLFAIEPTES
jgi:acetyl-CoA carboxylase biotin carboxyl carrier protein